MNIRSNRHALLLLLAAAPCVQAQELWDSSMQVVAGTCSAADKGSLGQKSNIGLTMCGAYPMVKRGSLVFEAGYRTFLTSKTMTDTGYTEHRTDGWFGGIYGRYALPTNLLQGAYVQAGCRMWQLMAVDTVITPNGDGTENRNKIRGDRTTAWKPAFTVGFRFNRTLSTELTFTSISAKNLLGENQSGSMVEFALGIHL